MGNSCLGQSGPAPVTLQIYDAGGTEVVKNVNTLLRAVGTGAFHTGVEVYGKEWSFGFTNDGSSGIFSCPPRCCRTHAYREAVPMGETLMSQGEVEELLIQLAMDWRGGHYDVLRRNCTHFSEEFCGKLGVGPVPAWVSNIALAGRTVDIGIQRVASFRSMHSASTVSQGGDGAGCPLTRRPGRQGRRGSRGRNIVRSTSQDLLASMKTVQSMRTVQSLPDIQSFKGTFQS
mmetsp:Transcript_3696/g.11634  ORF Transcript_3696/g.11634 Transcript_3696/m.11634 type:complete len:231 (-) Transcript_3696:147-839(-)